ncbi:MAG: NAD(P)H-dependent glycerol-3-phosphate dehydrogenase [Gemmatimonadota bacterium]|nr:MAG: NAD(P)H-dependent glycerol-3-phosphate dehydrogenase [Gemmatimonadota bacterium]
MNDNPRRVAVIGAGSWGTALAGLLAKVGHEVCLWCLEADVAEQITHRSENETYLPGRKLPGGLRVSTNLAEAVAEAQVVVSVSPSQFVSSVMAGAAPYIAEHAHVISASKGIEISTLRRMDQVLSDVLSPATMEGFAVLSGPSFAKEVADEAPTAVVVASADEDAARAAQALFQTDYFRVYTNSDVIGVELGGALKNVIALAAGVAAGLGLAHNTRAALLTRGLAEMTRLGLAMGARPSTFSGLAGMGDLVLTCTGELSRNRTVGFRLGQGEPLDSILKEMTAVAEGVKTVQAVRDLAGKHGVEMPIAEEVYGMLVTGTDPQQALQTLMRRDPKPEEWS